MATKPTKQQMAQAKARAGGNNPIKVTDKGLKKLGNVALQAAVFVGPGKFLKGAKIASEGAKVARVAIGKIGKDAELKAATSAAEVIKKEKYLKEVMARPVARNRNVPKPSTKSLTPNEKRYEALGKKAPVTVVKKKPMSPAKIREAKATARKAKFNEVLTPRPKPKPNRAPLKPIDNRPAPRVPPHKVDVKIMRKKKWEPDTSNAGAQADEYTRPLTNSGKKGSIVRQPYKSKAEIRQEGSNANNPLNTMYGGKPKPSISEGRGNTQQPLSVTKNPIERGTAAQKKEQRMEKRKARQADRRDKRADIAGAKRADYKKPRVIKYTTGPKSAKPGTTKKMKIGDQTVSRTNDPRNATSDAGNMRERLRAVDAKTAANRKRRAIGKGGNKVSPELKAKVEATLNSGKTARKSRELQNTFNKPKFSRNVTTGRLRATRPIKPVKK
jgi:hypothetical protein